MSASSTVPPIAQPAGPGGRVVRTSRRLMPPEGVPLRIDLAEPGERFVAFLIDILISTAGGIALLLLTVLFTVSGATATLPAGMLLSFLVRNAYFLFFEIRWGGVTPGKRIMGLRVIDRHGAPLRAGAIVARNLTRQAEFFFPVEMLLANRGWIWSPASVLPVFVWMGAMLAVYYRSHDRLRLGDLIGGTIVIAAPKQTLLEDLAGESLTFHFTPEHLQHYGVKELQVLEEVLRQPHNVESARMRREISERIQRRIVWTRPLAAREIETFLRDFYSAQRAFLEAHKHMGHERADKFHQRGTRP